MDRLYELSAGGLSLKISPFGCTIMSLAAPDRYGKAADVVLGYDTIEEYAASEGPCFGAVIGRVAGRIRDAKFELDGATYKLTENIKGASLHGGTVGFNKRLFTVADYLGGAKLILEYESPEGEEGYPGNLKLRVSYELIKGNALKVNYSAESDAATPVNFTNHSYFNLAGHDSGSIEGHTLRINSSLVAETDDGLCATGRLLPLSAAPLDFGSARTIDTELDHCFVFPEPGGLSRLAAELYEPRSGRLLEVFTNCPAMQVYTANYLQNEPGKGGAVYGPHSGICLETQEFQPFILRPGTLFSRTTIYRFSVL